VFDYSVTCPSPSFPCQSRHIPPARPQASDIQCFLFLRQGRANTHSSLRARPRYTWAFLSTLTANVRSHSQCTLSQPMYTTQRKTLENPLVTHNATHYTNSHTHKGFQLYNPTLLLPLVRSFPELHALGQLTAYNILTI
jgi:hypothetical protein